MAPQSLPDPLPEPLPEALVAAARAAAAHAYAPYSNFHVGAAVLLADGAIVTGANFENASYGLSLCAETVALATASAAGRLGDVRAIAVAASIDGRPAPVMVTPCGRCRQVINEAAGVTGIDLPVHCGGPDGHATRLISELLPHGFGPSNLER